MKKENKARKKMRMTTVDEVEDNNDETD